MKNTTNNMLDQDLDELAELDSIFGFRNCGNGSIEVGANVIAAMALNVANVSGGGIYDGEAFYRVGVNFVISGKHTINATLSAMNHSTTPQESEKQHR